MSKYNIKFYNNIKKFLKIPMKLLFKIEVNGMENLPNDNYVLIGNHKSMFDMPLLIISIPDEIHFMAKKELFDVFLFKDIFEKMGAFPVDRESADLKAMRTTVRLLKDGEVVGIFPEGTRNKTDEIILPFKDGAAKLSYLSKKLIVPFGINTKYKLRSKVILNIGEPIDITQIEKEKQTEYLEEKVKELVLKKN